MSESEKAITVLYDAECPLCLRLAQYTQRHTGPNVSCQSWQEFRRLPIANDQYGISADTPVSDLRLLVDGTLTEGDDAWQVLLALHPTLSSLSWLARKLGLEQQTARSLNRTGHLLRSLCPSCMR